MLQLCRRLNGHSLPESQDMRLAAGRRCCALLAARRPSWRCGGGTQRAWRPWQPPATYRGLATATWTTSCCTPRPARWCPSTSGARGGDALHSALLILLRLLGSHTGDIPCAEEFALHHMPACRGVGCAAGCCTPCTAESWGPQCVLRQAARRGRYSFGTGAQALPIPELVPFRLTRQLRGALQPHDACALLAAPLSRGLAALRAGRDALEVPPDA